MRDTIFKWNITAYKGAYFMDKKKIAAEATIALEQMKIEMANELGINNYRNMDKGNLTSRENGDLAGNRIQKLEEYGLNR